MLLIRRGCGIHVVWFGTGGSGVTGVGFAYPARRGKPEADRKYGTDGAVVADALFRVRATPQTGNVRLNGIVFIRRGGRIHIVRPGRSGARVKETRSRADAATAVTNK